MKIDLKEQRINDSNIVEVIHSLLNRHVTILDLSDSQLTFVPPIIGQLTNLIELNLVSNLFRLSQLKVLDLNINQFTILPPKIGQLNQLESLQLNMNQLIDRSKKCSVMSESAQYYTKWS